MNKRTLAIALLLLVAPGANAADPQPRIDGIESPDYVWNEMQGEKLQALRAKGDVLRGEIAFEVCQGCHRGRATGRPDGSYPRLAGQHASVLIKQMTDVRAGRRDNPKMYPFASQHVLSPQDIADVAVYLQGLPITPDNGKGPGGDLAGAKSLYTRDCASCHGESGEGDATEFYPRISGQHYRYLLREEVAIRDGERRNANPKMVKAVKAYSDADLQAVADYVSRMPVAPK